MIDVERHGGVAVMRIDHGRVNAMDVELLDAIAGRIADLESDGVGAAVLTGNARVFSAGVDLRRYVEGGPAFVAAMVPALSAAFVAVLRASFPIVAAINGAAIAGGAVLAAACDRRLLAGGARIGASELLVGVPFPVAALEVLGQACGRHLPDVVWTGRLYEGADAVRVGLVDEVVEPEALADRALAEAQSLAAMAPEAVSLTKAWLRAAMLERIAEGRSLDGHVESVWAAPETVARVAAYLDASVRRS